MLYQHLYLQTLKNNSTHAFSFTFYNDGFDTATGINFAMTGSQANIQNFTNGCTSALDASENCTVSGQYVTSPENSNPGPFIVQGELSYDQGSNVSALTNSNITDTAIVGEVIAKLGDYLLKDGVYKVRFKFINESNALATGVSVTHTQEGVTVDTTNPNQCGTDLAANSSCELWLEYTADTLGLVNLQATLSYEQGADATVSTQSTTVQSIMSYAPDSLR